MTLYEFVAVARDHYVDQFRAFAEAQRETCVVGAPEVALRLDAAEGLHRSLYRVDFLVRDDETEAREFVPEHLLEFDPVQTGIDGAALRIEELSWDDVVVRHDAGDAPGAALSAWFERWFDPDGDRAPEVEAVDAGDEGPEADGADDDDDDLPGLIHSMDAVPGAVVADLGTASPEAFWELLTLLARAGATSLHVSGGRSEGEIH